MEYKIKLDLKILPTIGKIALANLIVVIGGAVISGILIILFGLIEWKDLFLAAITDVTKLVTIVMFLKIVLENTTIVRIEDNSEPNLLLTEILKEIRELKKNNEELKDDNKIEN